MTRPTRSGTLTPVRISAADSDVVLTTSSSNLDGIVDSGNSTDANLGNGGIFTGVGFDTTNYAAIIVTVVADASAPSATDGLEFQFSVDNVDWHTSDTFTINAGTFKTFTLQPALPYFRLKYTNGTTPQTSWHLFVTVKPTLIKSSTHRIQDDITDEDDAELNTTVIKAKIPNGNYKNVNSSPNGDLLVSVVDPIGSLPVSQLTTLHDGKVINRDYPEIWENVGTGTGAFSNNTYQMSVTAGQYQIRQTRRFLPYYSGKPQKVEVTFDGFAPEADVTKRRGYFSSSTVAPYSATIDGLYLESSGGTVKWVAKNAGVTKIERDITAWTGYDVLNGYATLSKWDEFTVAEFNFLWLGGAYIELRLMTSVGWVIADRYVYAGTDTGTFIKSPCQPVRTEIRSTGGAGSLTHICDQVATSGSIEESGRSRGGDTGATAFTLSAIGTTYPVIGISKQSGFATSPVGIRSFDLFIASSDEGTWELQTNPTLSAPLSYSAIPNSAAQLASGNGTITVTSPGDVIAVGTLTQGQTIPTEILKQNFLSWVGQTISGTSDEYILCFRPSTVNVNVRAAINITEV